MEAFCFLDIMHVLVGGSGLVSMCSGFGVVHLCYFWNVVSLLRFESFEKPISSPALRNSYVTVKYNYTKYRSK